MKWIYENKKLFVELEDGKQIQVAEWESDLNQAQIDAIKAGYSPLFFPKGLLRYNNVADIPALYGITPTVTGLGTISGLTIIEGRLSKEEMEQLSKGLKPIL